MLPVDSHDLVIVVEGFADVLSQRYRHVRHTRPRCGARIFQLLSVCHKNPAVQWCGGLRTDIVRIK